MMVNGADSKEQTSGKMWQSTSKYEEEEYGSTWDRPLDLGSEGCSVELGWRVLGFRDEGSHGIGSEGLVRTEWRRQEVVTGFCIKRSCPEDPMVTRGIWDGESPCLGHRAQQMSRPFPVPRPYLYTLGEGEAPPQV